MKLAALRFLPVILILLLVGCDQSEPPATQDPKWSEYISAHTAGTVSRYSKIHVRFVNDVAKNERLGKPVDLLSASPAISGKAIFINPRELVLEPSSPLTPGQRYQLTLATTGLSGIPTELGEFQFQIDVIKQDFEVKLEGITTGPDSDNTVKLSGTLTTADKEEAKGIEQILSASYLNQSRKIEWEHNADGRHHRFIISGLQRQQQNQQLQLSWNGDSISVKNSGERQVEIPAAGLFKLARIQAVQADRQYIEITFSDKLDKGQNLRGLVTLSRGDYNTQIEDNRIKVYPDSNLTGEISVTIDAAIKSSKGRKLGSRETRKVFFMSQKPQVRFAGKGVILPENKFLSIPFEAVNVDSVQVTAFRIYENNMGQFLQTNKLDGSRELHRVGRYLWRKTIELPHAEQDNWNRYSLDATELLRKHPGGLFRLTLSINRGNSLFACSEEENAIPVEKEGPLKNHEDLHVQEASSWDYAEEYYNNGQQSNWRDRKNPCKDAYYKHASGSRDSRNFIASNIGIITKRGDDHRTHIVTTDLRTSRPLANVQLTFLNFQDQSIGKATTDKQGMATADLKGRPFYLIANYKGQRGYLKLSQGSALPTSHFNVGGEKVEQGIKGYIYGERGVWRPGDDIYLTFVLQDKQNIIPAKHPVTMNLYNPKGQLIHSATNNQPVGDFYAFKLKTSEEDLTGNWTARAILGGKTFSKKLKIETVIPNRLKVELDFGKKTLYASDMPLKGKLFSQWLHGATAASLKADIAVRLTPRNTAFNTFTDFEFDDPAREFDTERQVIFEDELDEKGYASFEKELTLDDAAPGMLTASFTSRVFEKGGAFSSSTTRMPFHPYRNYVGIKLPKGDATRNMLLTDTTHKVEIASVDADGKPVDLNNIEVTLYKITWKWWWDQSGDSLARYARASYSDTIKRDTLATRDGRGIWEFEVKYPQWGRYLIRACDKVGEHCTGKVFYIDWPGWAGRAREQSGPGANALNFTTDKPEYQVGETAHITLPEATQGRALVSIENGSRILSQRWVEFAKGQTSLDVPLTREMAPNVYVSITLVQPHQDKDNDRPIRLYGITPLMVKDPATQLKPALSTVDEWLPQSTNKITVSEQQGKAMTYTLAVVDEGLLGLTNFKTPDLHRQFYKKEALGVSTWDLFDEVTGAYGGELERLLSLGGGADDSQDPASQEKKRFPPVVKFLGPFELAAGKTAEHEVTLPPYIGAVRVMLVSGRESAYGLADKSVLVRDALSMLATVPRIIGPEETLTVPVTLFAMEPEIKQVQLQVETDDHFTVVDGPSRSVSFSEPGEQMGFIKIKTGGKLGKGRLKFIATSGKYRSESEIYLQVRSPNPRTVRQVQHTLEPGESWDTKLKPHGLPGTNQVTLEMSAVPPLNLERRLQYLIRYPHGCVEQVTSSVFPQLYLGRLIALDKQQQQDIENNVNAAIDRLRQFQHSGGGFMYWPGNGQLNDWATNYAGHFLVEANKLGYHVPADMLYNWINHQKSTARSWVTGSGKSELDQAYRLYTLALAEDPEIGAMNRLRESDELDNITRWQLASAYALIGQMDAAQELAANASLEVEDYPSPGYTFGSRLRDQAILLRSLVRLAYAEDAGRLAERISRALSADRWHSTQSIAFALLGMARYVGDEGQGQVFRFSYNVGDAKDQNVQATTPIHQQTLADFPSQGSTVRIRNPMDKKLYATLSASGIPRTGEEQASSQGLGLEVSYTDLQGKPITIDRLTQGSDLVALVTVRNQSQRKLENIALSHIVPSGWEIHNARLQGEESEASAKLDYQDIRDDRIYSYFSLNPGETRTIRTIINASYLGRYYLPGISVEAMYDANKQARSKGQWIEVVPQP